MPRDSYGWASYRTLQVRWLPRYLLMALLLESCGATAPPAQSRTTHTDNDYTEQDSPRVLRAFDASVVLGLGSAERVSGRMASVTCGDDIGCATDEAGQAYCWGRSRVDTPAMPAGVLHRSPTRIEVGSARRVQGHPLCVEGWTSQLRCWRTNRFEEFPWRVRSFDISRSGCVISLDGVLRCSALAHPEPILEQPPPAAFLPMAIPEPVVDVADSGARRCAVTESGGLYCWGRNRGRLGLGHREDRYEPERVEGLPPVVAVSMGAAHICALDEEGTVWCWGLNHRGQVSPETSHSIETPTPRPALSPATRVVAWGTSTCAVVGRRLRCTKDTHPSARAAHRFASASVGDDAVFELFVGLQSPLRDLCIGAGVGCMIDESGVLYCWDPHLNESGLVRLSRP